MPSTEELVNAARTGDTSAFGELVRRYERVAIITSQSVLGDFHSSQDVAQEAFVQAYIMLNRLHRAGSFGPWLLRIALRRALRLQRRRNAERLAAKRVDSATAQTCDWMEPHEEIVRQLARLPEHERIVVVMRYLQSHPVSEIAASTGRPVGTVTKQLSRAIQRLRSWLTEVQS